MSDTARTWAAALVLSDKRLRRANDSRGYWVSNKPAAQIRAFDMRTPASGRRLMYAKVFRSLFYGSLAGQQDPQHVFICLLSHCDRDGNVELPAAAMAGLCGISQERVEVALALLEGPDPQSRSDVSQGKRLERVGPWRWHVVNYERYRGIRDEDERRRQTREAVARYRAKRGKPRVSQRQPLSAQAEVEAEEEEEAPSRTHAPVSGVPSVGRDLLNVRNPRREKSALAGGTKNRTPDFPPAPTWLPAQDWADWCAYRTAKPKGAPWTPLAARRCLKRLERLRTEGQDPARIIEAAITAGWTGLFPERAAPATNGLVDAPEESNEARIARWKREGILS